MLTCRQAIFFLGGGGGGGKSPERRLNQCLCFTHPSINLSSQNIERGKISTSSQLKILTDDNIILHAAALNAQIELLSSFDLEISQVICDVIAGAWGKKF